jgi:predicted nucleotidyltransferase component of viral defense system
LPGIKLSLGAELLQPVALPIHARYDFTLAATPVVKSEEAVSEKLARYHRVSLARDLYDLQWFATAGVLDEVVVRRLWVLKNYRDIVVDRRGNKPIDPNRILRPRSVDEFREEDIGYLTKPVRIAEWIMTVRERYSFVSDLDEDETRWAACNERDRREVEAQLSACQ